MTNNRVFSKCKYCETPKNNFEILDSYKQTWVTCSTCGSTRSYLKNNIFFEFLHILHSSSFCG